MNKEKFIASMNEMMNRIHTIANKSGWWDAEDKFCDECRPLGVFLDENTKLLLMMCELAEVVEARRYQHTQPDKHLPQYPEEWVEIADKIIRALDFCQKKGIPVAQIICDKVDYNEERPYKHGNKKF